MANQLINTYPFKINKSGVTNKEKYPLLVGQPFMMYLVTKENRAFTAEITFNFAIENLCLKVYKDNQIIQGETIVRGYPTNLLLVEDLLDYALIYDEIDSIFNFYYLDVWYNNTMKCTYYEMLKKLKKREIL